MKVLLFSFIFRFINIFLDEDHFYVVMELVTGGELFEQVCTQRYYYEKDAAPLICQVFNNNMNNRQN